MKNSIWLLLVPTMLAAQPQPGYWQQAVDYKMDIKLDAKAHQFSGTQNLQYTNNSPDTLHEVFYHLYFNAFQPGSMMDVRSQNLPDPDKRVGNRISKLKKEEVGYHQILSLTQDGERLNYKVNQTVLKALLKKPLPPGQTAQFSMQFKSQVPLQIRRSGRDNEEGIDFSMSQWYPKMAAYDEDGWHPDPYVAREYYAPFGRFDVSITLPKNYKIGGTGYLQNPQNYWQPGDTLEPGLVKMNYLQGDGEERTWRFLADSVHTFAWAADEDYQHLQSKGPNNVDLHFFYLDKYANTWTRLPKYTAQFFKEMNSRFGVYPYRQFSVIQGGDGGMEYPMCTLLKGTGKLNGLIGVTVHEGAHSWFYGVLASNENQYPWVDEGFTSFAEDEVLNSLRKEPKKNPHKGAYRNHQFLMQQEGQAEPLATPADYYSRNRTYGINSYSRGQIFLAQLRYIIGEEAFNRGMLSYFNAWKFKHPKPQDFLRIMEKTSGMQLDWYLNFWTNTNKVIDYGFKSLKSRKQITEITLEKLGEMPMPLRVLITFKNGDKQERYLPVLSTFGVPSNAVVEEPWPWTHPEYSFTIPYKLKSIEKIEIDPNGFTADVNRANNTYPQQEGQEAAD
jgi:hypothetical protein